jgi:hypothetical protein
MANMEWIFNYEEAESLTHLGRPERIKLLSKGGIKTFIDEFDLNLRKQYFCPGCGGLATRSPLQGATSKDGKRSYFKHGLNQASTICPLYIKPRPGNEYLNEKEADRFVDHSSLVVCPKWSRVDEGLVEPKGDRTYKGIAESDWGEKLNSPIGRHYGDKIGVPNRITSVRKIAQNHDDYIMKAIAFPGEEKARSVRDILVNLNKNEVPNDGEPRLYFGKISEKGGLTKRKYININIDDARISIYVWPDDFESRGLDVGVGRIILFYGIIDTGHQIKLEHLGEFDLIPKDQESKFLNSNKRA